MGAKLEPAELLKGPDYGALFLVLGILSYAARVVSEFLLGSMDPLVNKVLPVSRRRMDELRALLGI